MYDRQKGSFYVPPTQSQKLGSVRCSYLLWNTEHGFAFTYVMILPCRLLTIGKQASQSGRKPSESCSKLFTAANSLYFYGLMKTLHFWPSIFFITRSLKRDQKLLSLDSIDYVISKLIWHE